MAQPDTAPRLETGDQTTAGPMPLLLILVAVAAVGLILI